MNPSSVNQSLGKVLYVTFLYFIQTTVLLEKVLLHPHVVDGELEAQRAKRPRAQGHTADARHSRN